jgi:hypothetical protein
VVVVVAGGCRQVAGITLCPAIILLAGRTAGATGISRQTPRRGQQYLLAQYPEELRAITHGMELPRLFRLQFFDCVCPSFRHRN